MWVGQRGGPSAPPSLSEHSLAPSWEQGDAARATSWAGRLFPAGTQAPPAPLATGAGPHFALGPWGHVGHAPGAGQCRGGAVAESSAVRGGGGGEGDMESGAYGAAKAGGSFDLRRFLTQPQVVTRVVCLVSRRGLRARGPDWAARPGRERGSRESASATGGGGRGREGAGGARGAGERARAPPPSMTRARSAPTHGPQLPPPFPGPRCPPPAGLGLGWPGGAAGSRPVALLAVGGAWGSSRTGGRRPETRCWGN